MLLGIDIGTSGTKTALFDERGECLASHTADYPMAQPRNGWAEQNPADWWSATVEGVRAVLSHSGIGAENIAGIGLSGQMHGLVLLDKSGAVLRPAILWCDQRTGAECVEINRLVGEKRVIEITANPPMTGFTASKILWVARNEPQLYAKAAHILLPKDYIRFRLTGELATEVSDASGTQLLDVPSRVWSAEVLQKLGIDAALLPRIYESPEITGQISREAADLTGLRSGTPVAGGAADNAAAAVAAGAVRQGAAFTTIGSSAVIYAVSDAPGVDVLGRIHGLCASVPGKWTLMSCTQGAGLSLKWLRETLNFTESYAEMDELARKIPIGSEKLLFLPYLMGERSPHPDENARGVFLGLSAIHTRAHMVRAVLEGVAFSQRECLDVFRELGTDVSDMAFTGGGAQSALWREMLADLYDCNVFTPPSAAHGAALGAALIAGAGVGVFSSVPEASDAVTRTKTAPTQPDKSRADAYEPYFALYKSLYGALKPSFAELSSL
jgi:xylulokinase